MREGKKTAANLVRSVPEPLDGPVLVGVVTAAEAAYQTNLVGNGALPARDPEPLIEGVAVWPHPDNTGYVYLMEVGGEVANAALFNSLRSFHVDRLSDILLYIPTVGDIVYYAAIAHFDQ